MIEFAPGLIRLSGDQQYAASGTCGVQSKLHVPCGNGIDILPAYPVDATTRGLAQKIVQLLYEEQPNKKMLVSNAQNIHECAATEKQKSYNADGMHVKCTCTFSTVWLL